MSATATTSSSAGSTISVPFGVVNEEVYLSGKAAAKAYALSKGFSEETFVEIRVEWSDQDPNAHVNNSRYFHWSEAGRITFIRAFSKDLPASASSKVLSGSGVGIILGEVSNKYLRPVFAPDHVLVAHRLLSLSDKKINLQSMIYSYAQKAQVCAGTATLVTYDYDQLTAIPLPTTFRSSLSSRLPRTAIAKL